MIAMADTTRETPVTAQPRVIARLPMLVGSLACACILGVPSGFFAAGLLRSPEGAAGPSASATMGVLPVAIGCVVSLLVLLPPGVRTRAKLGPVVVLAGTARLLFSLVGGTIIFLVMRPDTAAFFAALVTSAILCLIVEAVWGSQALRSASSGTETP